MGQSSSQEPFDITDFMGSFRRYSKLDGIHPVNSYFWVRQDGQWYYGLTNNHGECYLAPYELSCEYCPEGLTPGEVLEALQFTRADFVSARESA